MKQLINKKQAQDIALKFMSPVTLHFGDMAVFDTEMLNKAWSSSPWYIKSDSARSTEHVMHRLTSKERVKIAPSCELFRNKRKQLTLYFHDGGHRFALLRDSGAEEIKVVMTRRSLQMAKRHGFVVRDYEQAVPARAISEVNKTNYFDDLCKKIKELPRKHPWSLLREELRLVEDHVSMKPNASGCWVRKQYDRLEGQYNNLIQRHGLPA